MTAITSPGTSTPASDSAAAVCPCHGQEWYVDPKRGERRCRVKRTEWSRTYYRERMSGVSYNRKLLLQRRAKALEHRKPPARGLDKPTGLPHDGCHDQEEGASGS